MKKARPASLTPKKTKRARKHKAKGRDSDSLRLSVSASTPDAPDAPAPPLRRGRPTDYEPSLCERVYQLAIRRMTNPEMAAELGIDTATLKRWKKQYAEFCAAIEDGREIADKAVEDALFLEASVARNPDEPRINFHAAKFWLANRHPERWGHERRLSLSGDPQSPLQVNNRIEVVFRDFSTDETAAN